MTAVNFQFIAARSGYASYSGAADPLKTVIAWLYSGLNRDRVFIRYLPTPGAGTIAAPDHALLVNLRDDVAVAGEQ
jgi:hypothetical protein